MNVEDGVSVRADIQDVRYAYRVLPGRAPDAQRLQAFEKLVREHVLAPFDLARYFPGSNEFRARYSSRLVEIDLGGYVLVIRSDDNDVGEVVASTRRWEPHVVSVLEDYMHEGRRFLDVGANIGYFTAFAAHQVGSSGRVVAIEPMDNNLQLIYSTIARNGFANVRVEPFAASDASGVVCMGTHGGFSNGEIVREWNRGEQPLYAPTRCLDDLLSGESRFDVVKFDVEGHELHAWRGFSRTLERDRPILLTKFHPRCLTCNAGVEPEAYGAVLLQYGAVTVLHSDGRRTPCRDLDVLMCL